MKTGDCGINYIARAQSQQTNVIDKGFLRGAALASARVEGTGEAHDALGKGPKGMEVQILRLASRPKRVSPAELNELTT